MKLTGKTLLVAGGEGFIGSHLVERLIERHPQRIIIVGNYSSGLSDSLDKAKSIFPEIIVEICDATDFDALSRIFNSYNVDIVFNLAVVSLPISLERPEFTITTNIGITVNLCQLLRFGQYQRLVQFSSSEAFGSLQQDPMDEDHPLAPETAYGASKSATDFIALSYWRTYGCEVTAVRPFNQYGPRQTTNPAPIVPALIRQLSRNEPITIHGDGTQTRDFTYVTDTADAAIAICEADDLVGQVVVVGSGDELSVNDLAQQVADIFGYQIKIKYEKGRIGDVFRHVANASRLRDATGWEPKIALNVGLRKTVDWYLKRPNIFDYPDWYVEHPHLLR